MAGGYNIGVAMDARAVEKGVKAGIIAPVEDAVDKLQELGRAGGKAGDGISTGVRDGERVLDQLGRAGRDAGDDVQDGAREGERGLDKLGKAGRDAGDDIEAGMRAAQSATAKETREIQEATAKIEAETDRIKASSRESFHDAGGATGEFKDEALANFSEVTSSFQGDMSSITDLAQGTFGGLASLGGPASLVFGGIAVAVGLVGQALASSSEESDEFKEKIKELADTKLSDLFGQYEDSGTELSRGLRKWATDADSFGGSLADLRKHTRDAKLPFGELADAIGTQSVPKMKEMRREVEAQIRSLDKQAGAQRSAGNGSSALATKYGEQADAARAVKKQLDDNLQVNDQYEKSLRAVAKAQGMTVGEYKRSLEAQKENEEAAEKAKEAEVERVDARKAKLQEWADAVASVYASTAESESEAIDNSAMNATTYAASLEKRTQAAQQFQQNIQAIGQQLPSDLFDFVRDQGPGFSEEIATYLSASPEQKARIQDGWKIAAQVQGDTKDLDQKTAAKGRETKKGPTSKVQGDTKDLDRKVAEKAQEKKAGPTSKLRADDSAVDKAIAKLRDRTFKGPTAVFRVDQSSVNSTIAALQRTTVVVKVKAVP